MDFSEFFRIQRERVRYRYHALRNLWPIWFYALNREARSHFKHNTLNLDPVQQRIASLLAKDGIATAHISEFFPHDPTIFAKLSAYTDVLWNDPRIQQQEIPAKLAALKGGKTSKSEKYFFVLLLDSNPHRTRQSNPRQSDEAYSRQSDEASDEPHTLNLADPFLKFNLDPRIIKVVASYLGMSPKFHSYSLRSTLLVPSDSPPLSSQKWHRDPEDKKICKVFLYLTDVDEGSGPFMYIKGSHYGGKWRHVFPQRPPVGVYPPPGTIEKIIPQEDIKICTAPAGTIIFADTSGLHRGGYSTTKRRVMSFGNFTSRASIQKPVYVVPQTQELHDADPFVSYALKP